MNFLYNKHLCSRMVYTIVLLVLFAWKDGTTAYIGYTIGWFTKMVLV